MKILQEIIWIFIALILAAIVQFYIVQNIEFKFLLANTLVIFVSVYYTRLAVDLKNIFFFKNKWLKYFLISFNLFLFIFIITRIQKVIILFDVYSISSYSKKVVVLEPLQESNLINYIHKEFLFFSIFSLVAIVILNSKLLVSFWKK